jgi:uncharacterized repeat protein (TIGR03803 family)
MRHSRLYERCAGSMFAHLLAGIFLLVISVSSSTVQAQTFTDLYDFNCNTDGCNGRYPGRIAQGRDGNLYSTMPGGGNPNLGTIFNIAPGGVFNKIYNFAGSDGYGPFSGLTLGTDGNFYGATYNDGGNGYGTLFKITPGGTLTTLHNFTAAEEGGAYGTPVASKTGTYYGVTYYGKAYSITPSGTFKLLPNPIDSSSFAPLILGSDGNFYGTTITGGTNGRGSVFRMSTSGAITTIYSFDYTHGSEPYGPVVQGSDGYLYGTTAAGGSMAHSTGVVFKLSTKGVITVLHEFDNTSMTDGYQPLSGLVAATDGNFYGATSSGAYGGATQYGVLFKITKTGTYTVLHNFDSTHGAQPISELFQSTNGVIYGETQSGASGGGVFYSWNAGIAAFVSLVGFPAGSAGTVVQILGQGFNSASSVKFGTGSASFTIGSDTYMTATVPANGTTGAVTVTTSGGVLKSAQNYKVIPLITSFSPTSGPVGSPVTINGSGFVGASKVTFGGVKATTYSVNSAGTQITATVPTGAVTGKIGVTTTGGTASKGTFTVN